MSAIIKPQIPQINWSHPLADKLVFDMPLFERGGTNTKDISGGNNGALTNGPLWTLGLSGIGINFTKASNHYINLNKNPSTKNAGITMEALIRVSLPQITGFILFNGNDSSGNGFAVGATSDGSGSKLIGLQGGLQWWDSSTTLTSDVVTHVAMTFDASSNLIFYKDGIPDNRGSVTGNGAAISAEGFVGAQPKTDNTPHRHINGTIFYARMWNRVLTQNEICRLRTNPFQIYKTPTNGDLLIAAISTRLGVFKTTLMQSKTITVLKQRVGSVILKQRR